MTFGANKLRVFFPLVNLKVQNSTIVCRRCDMTSLCTATRLHWHLQRLDICRLEVGAGGIVTAKAAELRMLTGFMSECAR